MRIRRLVDEVDEQHREGMRTVGEDLVRLHLDDEDAALVASRRNFVRNLGVGAVAFGAVSVSGLALAQGAGAAEADSDAPDLASADIELVRFAQSVELAAVAAYALARDTGQLDNAGVEVARAFGRHHREHADALGGLLPEDRVVTTPNAAAVGSLTPGIEGAADQQALVGVLHGLEEGAAATYLQALGVAGSWLVARPVATILPIESMHAVVLGQMADLPQSDWMPAFGTTDAAFDPASAPAG